MKLLASEFLYHVIVLELEASLVWTNVGHAVDEVPHVHPAVDERHLFVGKTERVETCLGNLYLCQLDFFEVLVFQRVNIVVLQFFVFDD